VVRITWLRPEERIEHELRQLREEGVAEPALHALVEQWRAAQAEYQHDAGALRRRALALLDDAASLSSHTPASQPTAELSAALRASGTAPRFDTRDLGDRIEAAWTGRMAGCLLGKPVEKIPREGIRDILQSVDEWPLRRYFTAVGVPSAVSERWPWNRASRPTSLRENIVCMPEDDDINYTLLALHVYETYGPSFTTDDVATTWLQMLPPLTTFTAERVVVENLLAYVEPPTTALVRNPYREWIGAQIRADLWGYVRPGDPAAAAELAWRDARLSHTENGVYGAILMAALVAQAFVEPDPSRLVRSALAFVPATSRLAAAVSLAITTAEQEHEWERVLDVLHAQLGGYHWVHTINNAALVAAAIVHGRGDFEASVTRVVMGGWDTDSNGATVGSVCGARQGRAGVPDAWSRPLNGRVRSSLKGFDGSSITELARRTLACVPADQRTAGGA